QMLGVFAEFERSERLAFPLEARPEDRGVHGLFEAVAHVGGAPIFNVQVELANVRKKEVHDRGIVHELPPRQHHLIRALLVELLQPSTPVVVRHGYPPTPSTHGTPIFVFWNATVRSTLTREPWSMVMMTWQSSRSEPAMRR